MPRGVRPVVAGTAYCIASALSYAGTNICMRQLTSLGCDPMWATCNKELVSVIAVGPWLLYRGLCGRPALGPWPTLGLLVLIGVPEQLGANLGVQWAFGVVGLAVTVPAVFGLMLTGVAVMGRVFLGERVSHRSTAAIGLLLISVVLLGLAARATGESIAAGAGPLWVSLGVAAACLAGAIYALLSIGVRHAVTGTTSVGAVVFVITLMGVLCLGPLSVRRLGMEQLLRTPPEQIGWMLAAGTLNLMGFLAITKGLQLTTVVHANVLNASQVAMAAVAGMAIFAEPATLWLLAGIGLTILGILLIDPPNDLDRQADRHA